MSDDYIPYKGYVKQPDGSWSKPARVKVGDSRLDTVQSEPPQGSPLVSPKPRKKKSIHEACGRFEISFRVFAVQPLDWDNCHIKELQDGLVKAGLLPSDGYEALFGGVVPEKVCSEAEERTEIVIRKLPTKEQL